MLLIEVEGVYESDVGTGQKRYTDFNYKVKTSRLTENGIYTHLAKRFIPMLIANDKTKKAVFSRLRTFNILSIEKIEEDEECIFGKNIQNLNAKEIQDLACTFDLYDVPLNGTNTLNVIKEKAASAYLKKVWNIDLTKKNTDGTLKYDADEIIIEVPEGYLQKKKKKSKKLKVSDLIKAGQAAAQDEAESANLEQKDEAGSKNEFPAANILTGLGNIFKTNNET